MPKYSSTSLKVQVPFKTSPHLAQVYTGLQMLELQGIVECDWRTSHESTTNASIVTALIEGKTRVTYDTLDGFNWISGDRAKNLGFFHDTVSSEWYFKRSYHADLDAWAPAGCKVAPLGLNYTMRPQYYPTGRTPKLLVKDFLRDHAALRHVLKVSHMDFPAEHFESLPQISGTDRVLLFTRLWDPAAVDPAQLDERAERVAMNELRISMVNACRKEFGDRASAGIYLDAYSAKNAPKSLLLPSAVSEKGNYLKAMQSHSICVASTGLHGSTGWRFGEYVAASRAIVSEPLTYESGGEFARGRNYLEFGDVESLLASIDALLSSRQRTVHMMEANRVYYQSRVRPDAMILSTLMRALGHHE